MKQTIQQLNYLNNHADDTLKYIPTLTDNLNSELRSLHFLLYTFLERLRNVTHTIGLILKDSISIGNHDHSVGILLRSALLDALISRDLTRIMCEVNSDLSSSMQERLTAYANHVLCDGLDKSINNTIDLYTDNIINKEELTAFYNALNEQYCFLFEPYACDGSKPTLKSFSKLSLAPRKLHERNKEPKSIGHVRSIYDLYCLYSKYDHVSVVSYSFIRQEERKHDRINLAIFYLAIHSGIIHIILAERFHENDKFIILQRSRIQEYTDEIRRLLPQVV